MTTKQTKPEPILQPCGLVAFVGANGKQRLMSHAGLFRRAGGRSSLVFKGLDTTDGVFEFNGTDQELRGLANQILRALDSKGA